MTGPASSLRPQAAVKHAILERSHRKSNRLRQLQTIMDADKQEGKARAHERHNRDPSAGYIHVQDRARPTHAARNQVTHAALRATVVHSLPCVQGASPLPPPGVLGEETFRRVQAQLLTDLGSARGRNKDAFIRDQLKKSMVSERARRRELSRRSGCRLRACLLKEVGWHPGRTERHGPAAGEHAVTMRKRVVHLGVRWEGGAPGGCHAMAQALCTWNRACSVCLAGLALCAWQVVRQVVAMPPPVAQACCAPGTALAVCLAGGAPGGQARVRRGGGVRARADQPLHVRDGAFAHSCAGPAPRPAHGTACGAAQPMLLTRGTRRRPQRQHTGRRGRRLSQACRV